MAIEYLWLPWTFPAAPQIGSKVLSLVPETYAYRCMIRLLPCQINKVSRCSFCLWVKLFPSCAWFPSKWYVYLLKDFFHCFSLQSILTRKMGCLGYCDDHARSGKPPAAFPGRHRPRRSRGAPTANKNIPCKIVTEWRPSKPTSV